MDQTATLEILIQIRDQLAGLDRTRQGFKDTKKEAEGLGTILKQGLGIGTGMQIAVGAVSLLRNTFQATIGDAFRLAESVRDQSEALQMSTDAYQVLRLEVAKAGVDAARLTMAYSAQTQSLADARTGIGATADAYKALGLSAAELEKLSPDRRMVEVARATLTATDKTRAFQAAGQILGSRGLPQLLNGLKDLAENYDGVGAAAKAAGQVMSKDTVKALDDAQKALERFANWRTVQAGSIIQGADLIRQSAGYSPMGTLWSLMKGFGSPGAGLDGVAAIVGANAPAPSNIEPPGAGRGPLDYTGLFGSALATRAQQANQIVSAPLNTELEKRQALIPVLREQLRIYDAMIRAKFGDQAPSAPDPFGHGVPTDAELARYKEWLDLNGQRVEIMHKLQESAQSPLSQLGQQLADTTGYAQQAIAGGISDSIDGLVTDINAASRGTKEWGDSMKNLGNTAGSVLQGIITRMLVIQSINAVLGIFGYTLGPGATSISSVPKVKAAGGGTFMTRGRTNFTVGDNPGGVEMVSVTPISGVGRSTINGKAIAMAGGGTALVSGSAGGGDKYEFNYQFNGGVSRQEMLGIIPRLRDELMSGVLDAKKRRRGGFR